MGNKYTKQHGRQHTTAAHAGQAASYTLHGRPPEGEMPQIADDKVMWLQELLLRAGMSLGHGADGKYGFETHGAAEHIAKEAKLDLHTVNFNDPNSANYKAFMNALDMHTQAHDPVVTALATGQPLVAAAAPAPAPAAAPLPVNQPDTVPASIRGTEYDPRHLKTVSDAELRNILKDGLHGIHEIVGGIFGSYHRNGELGDVTTAKVFEQERKLLGLSHKEETLDRATLERTAAALGMEVARRNGLGQAMNTALDSARTTGALPRDGAVSNPQATTNVQQPTGGPANLLPPAYQR